MSGCLPSSPVELGTLTRQRDDGWERSPTGKKWQTCSHKCINLNFEMPPSLNHRWHRARWVLPRKLIQSSSGFMHNSIRMATFLQGSVYQSTWRSPKITIGGLLSWVPDILSVPGRVPFGLVESAIPLSFEWDHPQLNSTAQRKFRTLRMDLTRWGRESQPLPSILWLALFLLPQKRRRSHQWEPTPLWERPSKCWNLIGTNQCDPLATLQSGCTLPGPCWKEGACDFQSPGIMPEPVPQPLTSFELLESISESKGEPGRGRPPNRSHF